MLHKALEKSKKAGENWKENHLDGANLPLSIQDNNTIKTPQIPRIVIGGTDEDEITSITSQETKRLSLVSPTKQRNDYRIATLTENRGLLERNVLLPQTIPLLEEKHPHSSLFTSNTTLSATKVRDNHLTIQQETTINASLYDNPVNSPFLQNHPEAVRSIRESVNSPGSTLTS